MKNSNAPPDIPSPLPQGRGSGRGVQFICLALLLGHSALAADYSPAIQRLSQIVQTEIDQHRLSGVSIAIVEGQRILNVNGFGYADKKRRIPAARDTVYRAGSISKLFTALSVMQLAEQGNLSLDEPLTELVPDFSIVVPFADAKPITARQLLCHRSGMIRECPVGSYFDPSEPSLKETVRSIASCVLVYPPETKTKYSNIGVSIAGYAVEKVAGIPFEDYAREHLLRPLRMNSSGFLLNRNTKARLAKGYLPVANGRGGFREIEAPEFALGTLPAGNLYTTAEDLALFVRMLFANGAKIVRPESLAEMFTPQLTKDTNGFGVSFMIGRSRGRKIVSHSGAVYGFTSSLVAMPEEQLGVIVLCNDDLAVGPVQKINDAAWDLLLEAKHGEQPQPDAPTIATQLDRFAGEYESESYWASLQPKGGILLANISGQQMTFRPIAENRFEANGRLVHKAAVTFPDNASFTALGQIFHRLAGGASVLASRRPSPPAWKSLLGSYGPNFIPLIISERNGHLYAMTENMYDYRLTPLTETVFKMPPGLYTDEHLVFHLSSRGKPHLAVLANMPLRRAR
jgi:CubicO group peptidase (beta-lactamase class C family)